jgi:alpha-galactosidase
MFRQKSNSSLVRLPIWLTAVTRNWRAWGMILSLLFSLALGLPASASAKPAPRLALTPPMGWNDWAHYQCDYTAKTILANARALVRTGLAARGYHRVTIDDCWMRKQRSSSGNLQPNPKKFPLGMQVVSAQIHSLGLKFGIYEDAGYATCGGFAGSGIPHGGGKAHFLQDARLFAHWRVDYLKLDGCNVYARKGESKYAAYKAAYRAEHAALQKVGRPIILLESAPAYFQGTPDWYDVLTWARKYGQLWREGSDIEIYDRKEPNRSRFASIMWNYDYNLELGRFQRPGNWNDADFIIGGDHGVTLAETKTQLALWSMMSTPLILSSNINKLSPAAIRILGNRAVISIDQDPLGRMATLLQRRPVMDLLLKPLVHQEYAVAVLNRSPAPIDVAVSAAQLGFLHEGCRFAVRNLWSGSQHRSVGTLRAKIAAHDTAIWKIRPASQCSRPLRIGTITRIVPQSSLNHHIASDYTRCLTAPARVGKCTGSVAQSWLITRRGALESGEKCLAQSGSHVALEACHHWSAQRWDYDLVGNLINRATHQCLTGPRSGKLTVRKCGHNIATQIWALPNGMGQHQRLL